MRKYWEFKSLKGLIHNKMNKFDKYYTRPFSFYGMKYDYYTRSGKRRLSPTIKKYRTTKRKSYKLRSKWF